MITLRTQTRGGLWRASRFSYGSRALSLFQPTDASEPKLQPVKPPPAKCPPSCVIGDMIPGVRHDAYVVTEVSQWKKSGPYSYIYQATNYEHDIPEAFIVKELRRDEQTRHVLGVHKALFLHPNLQTVHDREPYGRLLIYRALPYNLVGLILAHPELPWEARKEIVKRALTGLVALHEETDLTHLHIRPDIIFVDYATGAHPLFQTLPKLRPPNGVYKVQLGGLEDATLPHRSKASLDQYRSGLETLPWKSPEFWIRGLQGRPSDVFSFGLTAVNLMLGDLQLQCKDTEFSFRSLNRGGGFASNAPTRRQLLKLERWFNYFGDADALKELLQQVEDEPNRWYGYFNRLIKERDFDSRQPLPGLENHHDLGFLDVITKMTHLDPNKRITAREALDHEWFADVKFSPEFAYGSGFSPFRPHDLEAVARKVFPNDQHAPPSREVAPDEQDVPPSREVVPDEQDVPPSREVVPDDQDVPPSREVVVPHKQDLPPSQKASPSVQHLIRKISLDISEESLQAYRRYSGPVPTLKRVVGKEPIQPRKRNRPERS
ncbi:kinase-like domain-containing protein [Apiosordaria backusii]|uniref:non-specific serine/threonine protein kinase n=1 Tax=Apiosordaria backusii TaxID=314023 RepID=A0AA40ETF6_9PEZI|nr:kinase-like domain-containing protein [Apiosordaria backusii]